MKTVRKCQEILGILTSRQKGRDYNVLNFIALEVGLQILDPAILFPAPPSDADPAALSLQYMHSRSSLKPVAHFAFRF